MNSSAYDDPAKASINLALPWHSVAAEIADLNFNIVTGKLNKRMDLVTQLDLGTLKSLVIPSRPPPAERRTRHFFWFINILMILMNKLTYLQDRFLLMTPS